MCLDVFRRSVTRGKSWSDTAHDRKTQMITLTATRQRVWLLRAAGVCWIAIVLSVLLDGTELRPANVLLGSLLFLFGSALRLLSFCVAPSEGGVLMNGPYAAMRHPRYVGTSVAVCGLFVPALEVYPFVVVLACVLVFMVHAAAAVEEEKGMLAAQSRTYRSYQARVPAFPTFRSLRRWTPTPLACQSAQMKAFKETAVVVGSVLTIFFGLFLRSWVC